MTLRAAASAPKFMAKPLPAVLRPIAQQSQSWYGRGLGAAARKRTAPQLHEPYRVIGMALVPPMQRGQTDEPGDRRRSHSRLALVGVLALMALSSSARPAAPLDPATVERTGRPNDFLICPDGACAAPADRLAPSLAAPPEAVLSAWREVILAAPRTVVTTVDAERLMLEAEQRSALFGFVDRIAVRVVALPDGRSSFAAYSRSETGYWDLGVNRRRLGEWAAAVERRLADG